VPRHEAPAPIDKEAEQATAGRSRQTAATVKEQGRGLQVRASKPVNIVRRTVPRRAAEA